MCGYCVVMMFENSIVCQCTFYFCVHGCVLIGLSANEPLGGLLVGVCRLGMWNTYLFECCLVFRLH